MLVFWIKGERISIVRRHSLRFRLLVLMLLLTTVPVLTLTWIAVQNTKASVKTQIIDANVTRVRWAVQYLEEVLQRFNDLFYSLQIQESFITINEDLEERRDGATRTAQLELRRLLSASFYSYSDLVDQLSYYSHISGQTITIDNKISGDISYPETEGPLWKGVFERPISLSLRRADGRVYALHTVNRFTDQRLQGVFYARVDESLSENILEIFGLTEDSSIYLLNDELDVLIGHPERDISAPIMQHLTGPEGSVHPRAAKRTSSHLVFYQPVNGGKLMVVKTVPHSLVDGSASDTAAAGLITGFVLLAASLVLSIIFSLRISRPIVELSESMRQATTPNFDKILGQDRDEIRMLQEGYESLMKRMKVLVQKEYEQEMELKDAHLMALQAQINPHFLNNTLNLLGGMALAKGVPEVYTIARAVGDMFRYTVGYQHDLVTLSQELAHSKNYLLVQEHRFSGRCKVKVEVEPEVLNTPIPQFILQPIVENAFDHGLQSKKDEWRVTVKGCVQRRAHIIVIEDNGVGMKPEELRALRDKLRNDTDTVKSRRSIGLRNVNARLQLQFGQRYGIRVFSTYGKGTRVVVVLPKDGANTG